MPRRIRTSTYCEPNFGKSLDELLKSDEGVDLVKAAMKVLSDIIDEIITEPDVWVSIGMSRNGSLINLVLHEGKDSAYASGRDLTTLLTEVTSL